MPGAWQQRAFPGTFVLLIVLFVFIHHQQVVSREFYLVLFSPPSHSPGSARDSPRDELRARSLCHPCWAQHKLLLSVSSHK